MDIEQNAEAKLISEIMNLCLESTENQQAFLEQFDQERGLIAKEMAWEKNTDIIDQYNRIYIDRMRKLSAKVPLKKIRKIEEVEEKLGVINITGLVKRLQIKRKRAFEKGYSEYYQKSEAIYSQKDELELEDPSGKVKFRLQQNVSLLGHSLKETDLPFGVVVGLTGKFSDKESKFIASEITLPTLPPQKAYIRNKTRQPCQILVLSKPSREQIISIISEVMAITYRNIKSVIIVGFESNISSQDYRQIDEFLFECSRKLRIFVMAEPTTYQIPKKPYHPLKFKKSKEQIVLCTNPQTFSNNEPQNQMEMLVLDSIILKDLKKNCSLNTRDTGLMSALLYFSHLAPTSPFSLRSEITPNDNLIIEQLPHLMLATNCSDCKIFEFIQEEKRVKMVTMKEKQSIIINQDSLDVYEFQQFGFAQPPQKSDIQQ